MDTLTLAQDTVLEIPESTDQLPAVAEQDVIFVPPKLSQEEETFALAMVEHAGNITRAVHDVYGDIKYPVAFGRQLLSNPGVIWKMKQLTDAVEEHTLISKASHLEQLARLRDLAIVQGNIKSAIHAEVKRGEAAKLYPTNEQGKGGGNNQAVQINITMASNHDENI